MTKQEKTKYLIIGNSAGGIGAAEAIRQVDKDGAITIVSDEPYPAYSRPLISEYLADGCSLERMLFRPPDFYETNNIRTVLGNKVERLDTDKHTVGLDDGRTITWEKLLLATGGSPFVPEMDGVDLKEVFTFTTLGDAKAIDEFLNQHPSMKVRAVVIGGGLIGISVTEALVKRDVDVTIVEMQDRILSTILDEETSALGVEALKRAEVEIITGHTVTRIISHTDGEVTAVTLDDGRRIPCEMVVVAIGVRPRSELVTDTDIKVNRGIVVDRYMATSSQDIYACGDVAEAYDFLQGENRLTPIWPNAYIGGRAAGFNMAGVPTEYQGGVAMNSMKYFGLAIVSAGSVVPPDDRYEVLAANYGKAAKKVVLKDGLIMGMVFSGDIEKSGIVYNLMKDKVQVEAFKQVLVAENFGLSSLPEEIWRPKLEMPASLSAASIISVEETEEVIAGE